MATRVTGQEVLAETFTGRQNFAKARYLNLKPDEKTKVLIKRVRLIGFPIVFYQCTDYQYDKTPGAEKGKKVRVPFPDINSNKNFTRIMREKIVVKDGKRIVTFDDDPWYQMGYIPQKRYAINCIDRDDGEVYILTKGQTLFGEFAKEESKNIDANAEIIEEAKKEGIAVDPSQLKWTIAGGEIAPDFKIKVTPDDRWQVRYEVFPTPKAKPLTDEEIEKLRSVGCPTDEEIAKIREEDPSLKGMPDWFLYGYPLDKIFRPTELVVETKREETRFDDLEDPDYDPYKEDTVEAVVPLVPSTSNTSDDDELDEDDLGQVLSGSDIEW